MGAEAMIEMIPLSENIGTEVRGIDVTGPMSDTIFDRIYDAWIDSTILLIRGQSLDKRQQAVLTDRFGERVSYTRPNFSREDAPDILILSNIRENGQLIGSPVSGRVWHTDGHYLTNPPAGSLLYAIETPPVGGDTMFANMFAAYAALPETVKARIADLKVVISRVQSRPYNYPDRPPPTEDERREWTDMPQPMVRKHPVNGRKALYAGGSVPWRIVGMSEAESAPLVTFVQEFAILPRFIYRHRWEPGDIIVWDNRSAMHRATPYDGEKYRRLMHRTTFGERRVH
jgi:taurine dioxygenase/putative 2-oxoglutarate oxygenase